MTGQRSNFGAIKRSLVLITEAMDILDAHGGPPDAAAHLALAQQRLREVLAEDDYRPPA